jgi:diguanylate cyclase (GGDEF)-like protein
MPSIRRMARALRQMTARHLHRRIVALFLGLLLLVQAASFLTIRHGIEVNARRDIAGGMHSGEMLLRRLLAQNLQQLREAARLLAADYGFRAAIAVGDQATLTDALANQAERIGANVAVFTDPHGRPMAATIAQPQEMLAVLAADIRADPALRGESGLQVHDGQPFQMVTVPVRAPQLIGQVSMGFPLSVALPRDLAELSSLRVLFLSRPPGGAWTALRVGNEAALPAALGAAIRGGTLPDSMELDGESTALHLVALARNDDREIAALLLRSIDAVVAPYRQLQIVLLAITLGGALVFAFGSFFTARRITQPINALAASAERLAAGDYASPVPAAGSDEVGDLARSFEAMRVGIRERDAEIRRLAYWDPLTGLPNREQFRELLRERLNDARRSGDPCSVLLLDIDRFKHVNDVLGHAFGDRLLAGIAARLSAGTLREHDTLARLGGDKFVLCLPRAGAEAAAEVAERLRTSLEMPLTLDEHTVDVTAGVGIASFPAHATSADQLLGRAELAMYAAKARQVGVMVYDPVLDSSSEESLSLLGELRTAIDEGQLRVYLQPKISLASGDVCGAEALVRWQHPRRGLLAPAQFVPFAEQTGFIRELTGWMVDKSARRCGALRDRGIDLKVSVNLSTKDLMDLRLAEKLERTLSRSSLEPATLCLEITESAIMDDPQRALATLQRLDAMGHPLSLDDFGTGYSSLAYLKTLPLHQLKIDRSFVMAMEHDRADLKIVRSTIDLAHNLGYSVVAEGVETAQTWAILRALKCDEAQGYFMARPMPEEEFAHWLDQWQLPQARLRTEFADLV